MNNSDPNSILLIEDDEDQIFLLSTFLETNGFTVECVCSTQAGIEAYRNGTYICAIVDLMMPDGGALRFLNDTPRTCPVIVVTAAQETQSEQTLAAGAAAVCSKHVVRDKLVPLINELML